MVSTKPGAAPRSGHCQATRSPGVTSQPRHGEGFTEGKCSHSIEARLEQERLSLAQPFPTSCLLGLPSGGQACRRAFQAGLRGPPRTASRKPTEKHNVPLLWKKPTPRTDAAYGPGFPCTWLCLCCGSASVREAPRRCRGCSAPRRPPAAAGLTQPGFRQRPNAQPAPRPRGCCSLRGSHPSTAFG